MKSDDIEIISLKQENVERNDGYKKYGKVCGEY